ncbi:S8 family serine peptidase [Pseudovibrio sp. Tun.PSC04-5.I4]|uniref:S8 family peptidase n=1 Tax=Pseudovibrio sp. Tun.PSC04-5.I4 TaxID=1798213 RepID=UPI00088331CC|nr:S8 family serine peptidase [Pseudovibrio sp. Tun.PSC04-5.I4]SDQ13231.1 Subtilase family protein [Pseudovibrio sp. Tun.PSC04-5.I4]
MKSVDNRGLDRSVGQIFRAEKEQLFIELPRETLQSKLLGGTNDLVKATEPFPLVDVIAVSKQELESKGNSVAFGAQGTQPPDKIYPSYLNQYGERVAIDDGSLIIGFKPAADLNLDAFTKRYELDRIWYDEIGSFGLFRSRRQKVDELLPRLRDDAWLLYAEPNLLLTEEDDDEPLDDMEAVYHFEYDGSALWNHKLIGLREAQEQTTGAGTLIAVVDSAADLEHPEIADRVITRSPAFNFAPDLPPRRHGTGVMSIAVGKGIGIASQARLLPVAIHTSGLKDYVTRARAINVLTKICREKRIWVDELQRFEPVNKLIVNCSWKLKKRYNLIAVEEAFRRLHEAGAIIICSAGNNGTEEAHFPSDYEYCLSVAGTTPGDEKTETSNYGVQVDICAPGGTGYPFSEDDIVVATLDAQECAYTAGTSFAAPHVAGAAALIWERMGDVPASAVIEKLLSEGIETIEAALGSFGNVMGSGRLNIAAAISPITTNER